MQELTPAQARLRAKIETGIAIAGPFLDGVLAIGERISRLAEPKDYEYYPVRDESDSVTVSHGGATHGGLNSEPTP